MRALVPVGLAAALLFAAPAAASADVIFDPADADDLAATLAEATASQSVCYGWNVSVSDPIAGLSESVGSNFGAGRLITSGECRATVEFSAYITYTSESSEAEDSATYDVTSSSGGPTRADLDALGLDMDGLTGENPDVVIGNAVTALPLLAADTGMAQPIAASPETGTAPADAQLTDSPGSDWWRASGGMILWGLALIVAGGLFAWWIVWINRRRVAAERAANEKAVRDARRRQRARGRPAQQEPVPQYVPEPDATPPTTPIPAQSAPKPEPEPESSPLPVPPSTEKSAAEEPSVGAENVAVPDEKPVAEDAAGETEAPAAKEGSAEEPSPDEAAAPSEEDVKPSDQKDKE